MISFELTIGNEVFISTPEEINIPLEVQIVENNLYGMTTFLGNEFVYHFSLAGPKRLSKEEITILFSEYRDN